MTKRRINAPGPMLIALTGARGAGKTTVASAICERYVGFTRMSFADPVRDAVNAILAEERIKDPLVSMWLDMASRSGGPFHRNHKDSEIPGIRMTPRDLLIEVGETARAQNPYHWIDILFARIQDETRHVVIDDLRYDREREAVQSVGGAVYWLRHHVDEAPDGDVDVTTIHSIMQKSQKSPCKAEQAAGFVVAQQLKSTNPMRYL